MTDLETEVFLPLLRRLEADIASGEVVSLQAFAVDVLYCLQPVQDELPPVLARFVALASRLPC